MTIRPAICLVGLLFSACQPSQTFRDRQEPGARIEHGFDALFNAERAYSDLRTFSRFWRIAGGPGYDSCLSYLSGQISPLTAQHQQRGALCRMEILESPSQTRAWVPEDAVLSMEAPEMLVLHRFADTPVMLCENSFPCDVTAPLTYVPGASKDSMYSQIDVRGKIVLCDEPAAICYRNALNHGALGVVSSFVPAYNRPGEHPEIIAERGLPYDPARKPFGINISPRTAADLRTRLGFQDVMLRVRIRSSFVQGSIKTLVAEIPGSTSPDQRVVLVAHLDHYKPGAHDNASGSATLLEMFRSLAAAIHEGQIQRPARTVTFLWVDEYRGTELWLKQRGTSPSSIAAAFALDMVGGDPAKTGGTFRVERMPDPGVIWLRPPDRHSGWGTGSWEKKELFGSYLNDFFLSIVDERAKRHNWKTAVNVWEGGSDHDPFLRRHIPALLSWHFPDFAYHSSMDVAENISPAEMKHAGVSLLTAAYEIALGSEEATGLILGAVTRAIEKRFELLNTQTMQELEEVQSISLPAIEASRKREGEIIDAWALWYDQALASILTVPAPSQSSALVPKVQKEREALMAKVALIKAAQGI